MLCVNSPGSFPKCRGALHDGSEDHQLQVWLADQIELIGFMKKKHQETVKNSLSEFEQKQKILNTLCLISDGEDLLLGFRRKSIRCVHFGSMHWGVKATPLGTPHALLGAASNGW